MFGCYNSEDTYAVDDMLSLSSMLGCYNSEDTYAVDDMLSLYLMLGWNITYTQLK